MRVPFIENVDLIKPIYTSILENGYKIITLRTSKNFTFGILKSEEGVYKIFSYACPKKFIHLVECKDQLREELVTKDGYLPINGINFTKYNLPDNYILPCLNTRHQEMFFNPRLNKCYTKQENNFAIDLIYARDLNLYIYEHSKMHEFFYKNYSAFAESDNYRSITNHLDDWHALLINVADFQKFGTWLEKISDSGFKLLHKKTKVVEYEMAGKHISQDEQVIYRLSNYIVDLVNIFNNFSDYEILVNQEAEYIIYGKENCKYCDVLEVILSERNLSIRKLYLNLHYTKEDLQNLINSEKPVNVVPHLFLKTNGQTQYIGGYVDSLEYLARSHK